MLWKVRFLRRLSHEKEGHTMIKFLIGVIVGMIIDMAIAYYDHKEQKNDT